MNLRVAVVHDWIFWHGGAERTLKEIVRVFPESDVFVFFGDPEFAASFLGREVEILFSGRRYSRLYKKMLPLFPHVARVMGKRLLGYDLVISSSHALAKNTFLPPEIAHLSYIYTPMRYVWDMEDVYARSLPPVLRPLFRAIASRLRRWDERGSRHVDGFIAISRFVARRVRRFYGMDASVVYPPVDVSRLLAESLRFAGERGDFYLVLSRLVPYKRFDLAVKAAVESGKKLFVAGTGEDEKRLRKLAGGSPFISFLGEVTEEEKVKLLSTARALIFPALEDFGIVVVESLACGTPVVGYGRGGVAEIVRDGVDGVLVGEQNWESFAEAMDRMEKQEFHSDSLRKRAKSFSAEKFRERFKRTVNNFLETGKVEAEF